MSTAHTPGTPIWTPTNADDNFGFALTLNGDIAYIGARFADIEANTNQGAIYRFNRFDNNWSSPLRILAGFAGKAGDLFGAALAAQGNFLLSGASGESIGGNPGQGAVYSFPSMSGFNNGKLSVSAADPFQRFGESVSLSGDTVIVGVGSAQNQVNLNRGRAFVFVRGAGGWTLQATLFPNDSAVGDLFGLTVAIQGNTALVGAPRANGLQGAAYIFIRNGTTWTQQAKLNALDTSNRLGLAVALANDTAIVGAPFNNNFQGAAYVFVRNGTNWPQQAKLLASDGQLGQFGLSVALEGDTALIGQQGSGTTLTGAAYIFTRTGAAWTQQVRLRPAIPSDSDNFGSPVALNGGTALIGAAGANSAYVFTGSGANWSQQAILRANTQANFGRAVALSGNTALIGAVQDLIVSTPSEAYVFVRNGTNWTQDSRLTAADANTFAQFGNAVALEGETLVIGAPGDAEATFNTGAVFIYRVLPAAGNTPPEIRSTGDVGLRQGSSGVIPLAIVSDVDQSPDTLNVTVTPETLNGMTLNNLQIDDSGLVRGNLSVACNAPTTGNTTFNLNVTDARNASVTLSRLITAPLPNTPPVLAYQVEPLNLTVGDSTNVRPTLGPSDNGAFTISLQSVTPAFAGQVTVNPTSGQVNIDNAAPAGNFTVTLRATDSCGVNTDASFNFNVAPSQLNTTTTLTSSRNPSLAGQPVTFTANVAFPTGTPNGVVTFTLDGAAQPPVTLAGGQASLTVPTLSLGLHTVVADYPGNATFPPGSDRLVQSVVTPIQTAWTATGSTGAVNEEDFAIMEMDGPRLGARATGVVNARYNVVAVEDANFEGADNRHLLNFRFRDTDGAGTAARVQVTLYRHEIDIGSGTTALFTFDSNNFPATGNRDLTVQLTDCAAGTNFDLDFRRYVYWVEAVITRNDTAQQAGFSGAQITETEAPCP